MIDRRGQIWNIHARTLLVLSTLRPTVADLFPGQPDDLTPLIGSAEHDAVDRAEGRRGPVKENQSRPWERRHSSPRIL